MRLIRGLAALVVLATLAAGIPVALVLLGGLSIPHSLTWAAVVAALTTRDDGTILIGLITVVAWAAWLVFALSLVVELVRVVSGFRIQITLPGLGGPQRLVAGLLLSVLTMLALPAASYGAPGSPNVASAPAATVAAAGAASVEQATTAPRLLHKPRSAVQPPAMTAPTGTSAASRGRTVTHRVQRGDDLWSLAEHYYGSGREWRRIAAANPALLTGGPDRLQPGWQLAIPEPDINTDLETNKPGPGPAVVTVLPGDSLSRIAERVYDDERKWHEIFDANRTRIDNPDEIDAGQRLRIPASDDRPTTPAESARPGQGRPSSDPPAAARGGQASGRRSVGDQNADATEAPVPANPSAPASTRPTSPTRPASPTRAPSPTRPASPARPANPTRPTAAPESPPTSSRPLPATVAPQASSQPTTSTQQEPGVSHDGDSAVSAALGVGAVGGLLAASLLGGLALRRRVQLHARPLGRRLPHPPAPAQAVETALGRRQSPMDPETVELAARAIAAHCRRVEMPLPALSLARVGPEALELVFAEPPGDAPVGFRSSGRSWHLERKDADYLTSVPETAHTPMPYPALTTLGRDREGRQVLVDLEAVGLLALVSKDPEQVEGVLAAMAAELCFTPWADELVLTLVSTSGGLPEALGHPNVTHTDELDGLLARLEDRARVQRDHGPHAVLGQHRLDPDLADPWVPEIVLINQQLTEEQRRRLVALTTDEPRVPVAAVVAAPLAAAASVLELATPPDRGASTAVLQPLGLELEPQLLPRTTSAAVGELVAATGSDTTTPAPWWSEAESAAPVDNVMHLGRRFGGWGATGAADNAEETAKETDTVAQEPQGGSSSQVHHPILRLLGPVELVGASGSLPPRAGKQCLEYCGWLLENPATTAQAMASALVVAEGTRRSNMSRLRTWLGVDRDGQPYLPDAYTGRILLHPSVSSDWQRLQILTAHGVNKTSSPGLRAALELVRGAPLADAAPGQWHWAEELRTDMISAVRDIGVELATRALADGNIDLARWAAARALAAAPGDELLMAVRIRTEHQAGHVAETERLTLQLAAQARALGVDLESETVTLLQEVMEGRVRARMA